MAKKDGETRENIDRNPEEDRGSAGIESRNEKLTDDEGSKAETPIKNANAAGIGAMGRNDQEQTGFEQNQSSDA